MATKKVIKKSKKARIVKKKTIHELLGLPKNQEEWLLSLIASSERCIVGRGGGAEELFAEQVVRIKKELSSLRKSK